MCDGYWSFAQRQIFDKKIALVQFRTMEMCYHPHPNLPPSKGKGLMQDSHLMIFGVKEQPKLVS